MAAFQVQVMDLQTKRPIKGAMVNGMETGPDGLVSIEGKMGEKVTLKIEADGYQPRMGEVEIRSEGIVRVPMIAISESDDDDDADTPHEVHPAPHSVGTRSDAEKKKLLIIAAVALGVVLCIAMIAVLFSGVFFPADSTTSVEQPGMQAESPQVELPGEIAPVEQPQVELPGELNSEQPGVPMELGFEVLKHPKPNFQVTFLSAIWVVVALLLLVEPAMQNIGLLVLIQGLTPVLTVVSLTYRGMFPHDFWVGAVAISLFCQIIAMFARAANKHQGSSTSIDFTAFGGTALLLLLQNYGAMDSILGYPEYIPVWILWAIAIPAFIREGARNIPLSLMALVLGAISGYTMSPWAILGSPLVIIVTLIAVGSSSSHKTEHQLNLLGREINLQIPWDSFVIYIVVFAVLAFLMRGGDWVIFRTLGGG